jgi:hypothetical protein
VVLNTEATPVLGWIDDHEWTGIENPFCITIYNEGAEEFVKTIRSVFVSLTHIDARPQRPPSRHVVCVIFDGREHANQAALASLADFGLLQPTSVIRSVETDFCRTRHGAAAFLSRLDGSETRRRAGNIRNVNIIIC